MKNETARLVIKDSVIEECDQLQKVYEASDYIEKWVGWKTPPNHALTTITEGNLPPDGKKENFRVKTIVLRQTNEIIGVLELYRGFPSKDVLCIGWLFILPEYQKMGFAKEVVDHIISEAKRENFRGIRLGVHLKNWPALRFWHKAGFDNIAAIIGDEVHSENTYASIALQMNLD
jgi:ribosomal protein S18 acetylase RimI-like enzyme